MLKLKYGEGKYFKLTDDDQLHNMNGEQESISGKSAKILRIAIMQKDDPIPLAQFQKKIWPETQTVYKLPEDFSGFYNNCFSKPYNTLEKTITKLDPDADGYLKYKSKHVTSRFTIDSSDEKLKTLSDKIVKSIWDKNKNMGIRDGSLNRSNHGEELCDLYVIPGFCFNDELIDGSLFNLFKQGIQRVIIEAPSGYGKTSLAQAISLCCTYKEYEQIKDKEKETNEEIRKQSKYNTLSSALGIADEYFPVFIDSSDVKLYLSEGSIITILYKSLSLSKHVIEEGQFKEFLEHFETKFLLIIDGYDEIENRDTFNNCLKAVFEELPHAKIIMTTRPMAGDSYGDIAKYFTRITIDGLQEDEIRQKKMIAQYLQYKIGCGTAEAKEKTREYFEKWSKNEYYRPFMESPYLLTHMLTVDKDADAKPIDVVKDVISALLKRYSDQTRNYGLLSDEAETVALIFSNIAYQMLIDDEESFLIEEFPSRFKTAVKNVDLLGNTDIKEVLAQLSARVTDYIGLINVRSGLLIPESGKYVFQIGNITRLYLASLWLKTMTMTYISPENIRYQKCDVAEKIRFWVDAINPQYRQEILLMYLTLLGTDTQILEHYGSKDLTGELVTIILDYVTYIYISITAHEDLLEYSSLLVKILINYFGENGVTKVGRDYTRDYYEEDDISPKYEDILLRMVINLTTENDYKEIISKYQPNLNDAYKNRIDSLREKGMLR